MRDRIPIISNNKTELLVDFHSCTVVLGYNYEEVIGSLPHGAMFIGILETTLGSWLAQD